MTLGVEEPLDRLNYYNGRRLVAGDLRLEQDYHIRVRRWLNKTLFTPGIADGLEVRVSSASPRKVVVSPGLAIDALGREVILVEETEVDVVGVPSTEDDWVFGNYLTIEYAEETVASAQDGCAVRTDRRELAWGGPTLIRATPVLAFQGSWPDEAGGKVLLGQVELGAGCEVTRIHNGVRKYVDAAAPSVRSLAFEGEKDIDQQNPKVLSFHIRGGPPRSVLLYLWGGRFSTLFYTELPAHTHPVDLTSTPTGDSTVGHTHEFTIGDIDTSPQDAHSHDIEGSAFVEGGDISLKLRGGGEVVNLTDVIQAKAKNANSHFHTVSIPTKETTLSGQADPHAIAGDTGSRGVTDAGSGGARTSGSELTYVRRLKVYLDGNEITSEVLTQLGWPAAGWSTLGDGTAGHPLVMSGTGAIDLLRVNLTLVEGEHKLELRVDNSSGGNIRYNLYVS
jgi:hypothetical protein